MAAVTQKAVEAALKARYSGISIDVGDPPVSTPVSVFLDYPSPDITVERTYPSVSILLLSMTFDAERAHSDDEDFEEVAYNTGVTPYVRTMRQKGLPFILSYSIDTWHKDRAFEERDLLQEAVIQRTPPRGYITVTDIDSGSEDSWVFWDGNVVALDEVSDFIVYHKSLTVRVLATMLTDPVTYDAKVAMSLDWKIYSRRSQDVSDDVLDLIMRITEAGVEPAP